MYFQRRVYVDQSDFTYYVVFVYLTYTLEMCVGISTSCMPSLARLHKDKTGAKLNKITSSLRSPFSSFRKSIGSSNRTDSTGSLFEKHSKSSSFSSSETGSEGGLQLSGNNHEHCGHTLTADQKLNKASSDGQIHRSVAISQTVAVASSAGSSSDMWDKNYP